MIKRMHHRWLIIISLLFGLVLDSLLWALGSQIHPWSGNGAGRYFVWIFALTPLIAVLLVVFAIFEFMHVNHKH